MCDGAVIPAHPEKGVEMSHADYRKHNHGSESSSAYRKQDGTPSRAIEKKNAVRDTAEFIDKRCPKCNASLLRNARGDEWCSFILCDYGVE